MLCSPKFFQLYHVSSVVVACHYFDILLIYAYMVDGGVQRGQGRGMVVSHSEAKRFFVGGGGKVLIVCM